MSVLVKGMEMPINADMAPTDVRVYPNGYAIVFKDNGRMEQYTQAVPVPPHGRLIDADFLGKILKTRAENEWNQNISPISWSYAYECLIDILDIMPTIIPDSTEYDRISLHVVYESNKNQSCDNEDEEDPDEEADQ